MKSYIWDCTGLMLGSKLMVQGKKQPSCLKSEGWPHTSQQNALIRISHKYELHGSGDAISQASGCWLRLTARQGRD